MALQIGALFEHDARGRLVAYDGASDDDRMPPRLFLGITRLGVLWRLRADLPDALARELSRLVAAERRPEDLDRLPERVESLRLLLGDAAPIERVFHGPAFRFPDAIPGDDGVRALVAADAEGPLLDAFPGIRDSFEEHSPVFAVVEDGVARSVAYAATMGPAAGPVEVGVHTDPAARGRGLAPRVVAAFACAIRESGGTPLYSTSFDNAASRAVARKLGLIRYGTDLHFR